MDLRALLMALLVVPMAAAWDDAADDVEVGVTPVSIDGAGQTVWLPANPAGWYPNADLRSATITETQDTVTFEVSLASREPVGTEPSDHFVSGYAFDFTLRGNPMSAFFLNFGGLRNTYFSIGELTIEDFGFFTRATYGTMAAWEGSTVRATVPKAEFRDFQYVPLRKGDVLEDVSVRYFHDEFSISGSLPPLPLCPEVSTQPPSAFPWLCTWRAHDVMPDLGDITIELAPSGVGHLLLRTDRPWRLSNGLATTYLFEVELHNFDDIDDTVALQAVQVPAGWEVLHPTSIDLDGKTVKTLPVAVTVPFIHNHGDTKGFRLQGLSTHDASVKVETTLGVVYADPAQPGGHHDTLFFHAYDNGFSSAWMNTVRGAQEGEGDRARGWDETPPTMIGNIGIGGLPLEEQIWRWDVRLNPSLAMGLDFDLSRRVEASVDLEFAWAMDAEVSATLFTSGTPEREPVDIAMLEPVQASFGAGISQTIDLAGTVAPAADRIPYGAGNLYLRIEVRGTPDATAASQEWFAEGPWLLTGGSSLRLPLFDYHDEVDLEGLFLNAFQIGGNRTFAHVNPGKTAAFVFNVTNLLSDKDTLSWTVSGTHAEWAKVVPAETVVAAGGTSKVVVAVTPPAGTEAGETAELLLRGTSKSDPERQVFVRMTAAVEDGDEIPDESELAKQEAEAVEKSNKDLGKESPAFEVVAVLAALGAAVAMLRRRA